MYHFSLSYDIHNINQTLPTTECHNVRKIWVGIQHKNGIFRKTQTPCLMCSNVPYNYCKKKYVCKKVHKKNILKKMYENILKKICLPLPLSSPVTKVVLLVQQMALILNFWNNYWWIILTKKQNLNNNNN